MEKQLLGSGKLTRAEVIEIRRVFNIIDVDGSGELNPRELAQAVSRLTGSKFAVSNIADVTNLQIFKIWHKVDQNNDAIVSWEEFLRAISEWLIKTESTSHTQQAQILETGGISDTQRKIFHRNISNFFLQFQDVENRDVSNISALEQEFVEAQQAEDIGQLFGYEGEGPLTEVSEERRIQKFKENEILLEDFPAISVAINSMFPAEIEKGLEQVRSLFEILSIFGSPGERQQIGAHLTRLFDLTISSGVLQKIVSFVDEEAPILVQWSSLLILTYFAPGPRIPHTPHDSQFHPSHKATKQILVKQGLLPKLIILAKSKCEEVREQSIVLLGFIARHDNDVRDLLRHEGVIDALLEIGQNFNQTQISVSLLRKLTWTLSILTGSSLAPPVVPLAHADLAKFLASILFTQWGQDKIILTNIVSSLRFLLPEVQISQSTHYTWLKVLSTIAHQDSIVRRVGIRTLCYLLQHINQEQVIFLVENNMMEGLEILMTQPDQFNRKHSLSCLNSLVERKLGWYVLNSSVPSRLVPLLYEDAANRLLILKLLSKLTEQGGAEKLLDLGVVRAMFYCLSCVRSYDHLLSDVYGFLGATYDFELMDQSLHLVYDYAGIGKELSISRVRHLFSQDAVQRLEGVIKLIFSNAREVAFDIKYYKVEKDISIFDRLEATIKSLGEMFASKEDETCRHNAERLEQLFENFKQRLPSFIDEIEAMGHQDFQKLLIKCFSEWKFPDGDNRILEVNVDISLLELFFQVEHRYEAQNLKLLVPPDRFKIDSQQVWQHVLDQTMRDAHRDGAEHLELRLIVGKDETPWTHHRGNSWDRSRGSMFGQFQQEGYRSGTFAQPSSIFNIHGRKWESIGDKKKLMKSLTRELKISNSEVERLYESFKSVTKKRASQHQEKGYVTKEQFVEIMRHSDFDAKSSEHLFNAFDHNDRGVIDFRDFAAGYATMKRGSIEDRLRFAFLAFDLDRSGYIDRDELLEMLKSVNNLKGNIYGEKMLRELTVELFRNYDSNRDGKLSFAEFRKAVEKEQLLLNTFWEVGL